MGPMTADRPRYWFPAKRYGWGWGPPVTWQGWVVVALWLILLLLGLRHLASRGVVAHAVFVGALTVLLVVISYVTGEPPKWRWGNDD